MSAEIRHYVREALAQGVSRNQIRDHLLAAGWRPAEIENALDAFAEIESPVPVPRRRPYLSARETFFYLVLFVTLYVTAFNVGHVLFQVVNREFPDMKTASGGSDDFSAPAARSAVAGIIIAFPVFLFMARVIGRAIARDPEKRASKIRKWLTYITLFVSACVLIGDLTFLVTQVLSGELVMRIGLKVLVVFLIAGVVFAHYLGDLRREEDRAQLGPAPTGWLARLAGTGTLATLAVGLFLVGTPGHERARRLDDQRSQDLRLIANEVESYYESHRALPASLAELRQEPSSRLGDAADPGTGQSYDYQIVDSTSFEVGARFETVDSLVRGIDDWQRAPRFWRHGAGPQTYRLTIPPRLRAKASAPPVVPAR